MMLARCTRSILPYCQTCVRKRYSNIQFENLVKRMFLKGSTIRQMSSFSKFREKLQTLKGGSVDLYKDDLTGIATLLMNHPEKRNAFSDTLKGGSVDLYKDDLTGIATLLMNHPEKRNAFSGKMMLDLEKCVSELENWSTGRGVVLAGEGGTFCSGGDLDTVEQILKGTDGYNMSAFMHDVTSRLHNLPMISVAAINGFAIGGGAEMTTACDFRIMTDSAKIGFVQIKVGVAPGWGGCTRLVNILGREKALQLLVSGKLMDSEYCRDIGYVSKIVDGDKDVVAEGTKWLLKNCAGDAKTVGVIKTMVATATELNRRESLERERHLFSMVWGSEGHVKALDKNLKHK